LEALEKRVQQLEERVATLTSSTAPAVAKVTAEQRVDQQRKRARERMRKDSEVYSREELQEIEKLYQVANKQWRSQEGKDSLKKLVDKFDKANRTGCALLYLGQMSEGEEREDYLQKAIDGFSDCYYGDGVQVGAYARYYLAHYYKDSGEEKKAEELFEEIRSTYPDAIDHRGRLLADRLDR
jgi:tetratricopeptide (TPR) repeat protein